MDRIHTLIDTFNYPFDEGVDIGIMHGAVSNKNCCQNASNHKKDSAHEDVPLGSFDVSV